MVFGIIDYGKWSEKMEKELDKKQKLTKEERQKQKAEQEAVFLEYKKRADEKSLKRLCWALDEYKKQNPDQLDCHGFLKTFPPEKVRNDHGTKDWFCITFKNPETGEQEDYVLGKQVKYFFGEYKKIQRGETPSVVLSQEDWNAFASYFVFPFKKNESTDEFFDSQKYILDQKIFVRLQKILGDLKTQEPQLFDENGKLIALPKGSDKTSKLGWGNYDKDKNFVRHNFSVQIRTLVDDYNNHKKGQDTLYCWKDEQWQQFANLVNTNSGKLKKFSGFQQFLNAVDAYAKTYPESLDEFGRVSALISDTVSFFDEFSGENVVYDFRNHWTYYRYCFRLQEQRTSNMIASKEEWATLVKKIDLSPKRALRTRKHSQNFNQNGNENEVLI